jgi:branched-chain amino acid transport system permease protein
VTIGRSVPLLRAYRFGLFLAVGVTALALPLIGSPYLGRVATTVAIYATAATGLNLILGHAGLVSFGQAAVFGLGAYTVALLMADLHWDFLPAAASGILLALAAGALVGLTAWRVRGDYLALITIGFSTIATLVMNNWTQVTRGPAGLAGIPLPDVFGLQLQGWGIYDLCLVGFAIATVISTLVSRSYVGRALLTIRADETLARANGINVPLAKVVVFALGAAIAGIAGSLQAVSLGYVGPATFGLDGSIFLVEIVVVGGMAAPWGPLIGATVLVAATEIFRFSPVWRPAAFGLVMIVILIIRADGLAGLVGLGRGSPAAPRTMSGTVSADVTATPAGHPGTSA